MAVVFLLGEGERPTERMLATCRRFMAGGPAPYTWSLNGASPPVRPHNAVRATACPGPELTAWIKAGLPVLATGGPVMPTPPKPPTSLVQQWQEMLLANGADLGPSGADGQMGRLTLEASRVVHDHRNQLLAEAKAADEAIRAANDQLARWRVDVDDLRKANATSSATIVRLTEARGVQAERYDRLLSEALARQAEIDRLTAELEQARKANGTAALAQLIATVEGGVAEAREGLA
jgi:hypothetical protein